MDNVEFTSLCVCVRKAKVIPVYDDVSDLLSVVLEETGGLGVDIVIDSGGMCFSHNHTLHEPCNLQLKQNVLLFVFESAPARGGGGEYEAPTTQT